MARYILEQGGDVVILGYNRNPSYYILEIIKNNKRCYSALRDLSHPLSALNVKKTIESHGMKPPGFIVDLLEDTRRREEEFGKALPSPEPFCSWGSMGKMYKKRFLEE